MFADIHSLSRPTFLSLLPLYNCKTLFFPNEIPTGHLIRSGRLAQWFKPIQNVKAGLTHDIARERGT
jgi:hypothetical protein